jgi:hypothetical protein
VKDTLPALRNTAQELANRLNEYERILYLVRSSQDIGEIHGLVEALKIQDVGGRTSDLEDAVQSSSAEGSAMIISPTSSVASSLSPESSKALSNPLSVATFSTSWHTQSETVTLRSRSQSIRQETPGAQERAPQQVHLELFGNIPISCSSLITPYTVSPERQEAAKVLVPEHLIQPLWNSDNSPLSKVFVEYRDAARRLISEGTSAQEILGPDFVSVDLFFRGRQPADAFNVCSWACEVSKGFYMIDIQIRLALASLFTYLMRVMP